MTIALSKMSKVVRIWTRKEDEEAEGYSSSSGGNLNINDVLTTEIVCSLHLPCRDLFHGGCIEARGGDDDTFGAS